MGSNHAWKKSRDAAMHFNVLILHDILAFVGGTFLKVLFISMRVLRQPGQCNMIATSSQKP